MLAPCDYGQFKHVIIMQYHVIVASLLGAQCLSGVPTMSCIQALFPLGSRAANDQVTVLPVVSMPEKKKTPHPRTP